ncbi:MAG: cysteine synthase B, partial [Chloroflexi bacterium]|nr:cysteine synthase B [Chloroflexota bacterium]
ARRIAERMDRGKIVCLLADGGWKYLSTRVYETPVQGPEGPLEGHFR